MKKTIVTKIVLISGAMTLAATATVLAGDFQNEFIEVPEPGALTLIGAGLAALVIGSRLRKRK